jgi:hypothetical protein
MFDGCRLSARTTLMRSYTPGAAQSAAAQLAACAMCAASLASAQAVVADHLGYRVEHNRDWRTVPLWWRQRHWVLLRDGPANDRTISAA